MNHVIPSLILEQELLEFLELVWVVRTWLVQTRFATQKIQRDETLRVTEELTTPLLQGDV
jgi:hypothetical protein